MLKPDGVYIPDYLPACYCNHRGMGLDLITGEYVKEDPYRQAEPVYVRIGGRNREAQQWLWLWRIVRWVQNLRI